MQISERGQTELKWRIDHILEQKAPLQTADPSVTLKTDRAHFQAALGSAENRHGTKSPRTLRGGDEKYRHVNYLELLDIFFWGLNHS